jgi:uncharacterized protein YjbI with pentapeptide repeats
MKVLKPNRLSVFTRPFEVRGAFRLGISILGFFDLQRRSLLEEVELWKFLPEELGKDAAIDVGIPKSRAEYLVHGSVFVPGGVALETCPISVTIGRLEKTLYVVGDRFWKGKQQSRPQTFASMPVSWERAFGGPGFARNPLGKGFAPVETEHGPIQFLPNIETPGKMISSPKQQPEPGSFGPLDITWPQRFSKVGTYDLTWLKERFPGFADDIDWTIHNMAPEDQQQPEPFLGTEEIRIVNMHPERSVIEGRLPGCRARAFVTQRTSAAESFIEVPMRLMTVWLFPHVVKGILVFQGSVQTTEDDAADIVHLMLAAESLGEDKGLPHYQNILAKRLDKENGVLWAMRDQDLLPILPGGLAKGIAADDVALVTMEGLLAKNTRKKGERELIKARELVASYGLNPDTAGPTMPPPEEPLPEDPLEMERYMEESVRQAKEDAAREKERMEQSLNDLEPLLLASGRTLDDLRREIETPHVGPPRYSAESEIARFRGMAAQARSMGMVIEELEDWSTNEEVHQQWRDAEQKLRDMYLAMAHHQGTVPARDASSNARIREEVVARYLAGESFAYLNLSGADLSGMDLRGADFRHGWLESVSFRGANLHGAQFGEAVMARADLSGALVKMTSFHKANLGGARLQGILMEGEIDFTETTFAKADLSGVDLNGARITKADFDEALFSNTRLTNVIGEDLTFYKTDLRGVSFAGARLKNLTFVECDIRELDLSDSELEDLSFVLCKGRGIKLFRTRGKQLATALCESFAGMDGRGAFLETVNMRGLDLEGSDFSGATLKDYDFSEAVLKGSKAYRLVARDGLFVRTDFRDSDLTSADLMGANLQNADIRGTRLRGANLYGANFGRVRSDEATDLHDSNQKKVTIYPLRHEA